MAGGGGITPGQYKYEAHKSQAAIGAETFRRERLRGESLQSGRRQRATADRGGGIPGKKLVRSGQGPRQLQSEMGKTNAEWKAMKASAKATKKDSSRNANVEALAATAQFVFPGVGGRAVSGAAAALRGSRAVAKAANAVTGVRAATAAKAAACAAAVGVTGRTVKSAATSIADRKKNAANTALKKKVMDKGQYSYEFKRAMHDSGYYN